MTWGNPPKLEPTKPKQGKAIQPQDIAKGSEHSHQSALFAWAALNVGKYPQLRWMFAIPNGGLRDMRTAVNLKAEGVKAGVPDIFLPYATYNGTDGYFGLFIEMKIGKNKPTKEQVDWLGALSSNYYCIAVCYSWEEARDVLINYLKGRL
jgi:hypothetical protein